MMNTYLMSIKELQEVSLDSGLYREALEKVDSSRREKIMRLSNEEKKKVSLGAGLLLQYAVEKYEQTGKKFIDVNVVDVTERNELPQVDKIQYGGIVRDVGECLNCINCLNISEILKAISHPQDFTYCYGQNGKPYFTNLSIHFNLSHSGDYVLCALSDREVGADIQQMNDIDYWKTAERFFQSEEVAKMRRLATMEEQKRFFYKLWARKEAYGKFTGEGVTKALFVDMIDFPEDTLWEEYEDLDGYCIAVCQGK